MLKQAALDIGDKSLTSQIDVEIAYEKQIDEIRDRKMSNPKIIINWYGKKFKIGEIK